MLPYVRENEQDNLPFESDFSQFYLSNLFERIRDDLIANHSSLENRRSQRESTRIESFQDFEYVINWKARAVGQALAKSLNQSGNTITLTLFSSTEAR